MLVNITARDFEPVDAKFGVSQEDIDWIRGFDRLHEGVFQFRHFNSEHLIREKILTGYPRFSRDEMEFYTNLLKVRPDDDWVKREYEACQRCPENVESYYRRENWVKRPDGELDDNQFFDSLRMLNSYGVCDDCEQLLSLYDFERDPRNFFISMVEINKVTEPPENGWRWHKWGPYVGRQEPQCEYIAHEPVITRVFVYHVYELEQTIT